MNGSWKTFSHFETGKPTPFLTNQLSESEGIKMTKSKNPLEPIPPHEKFSKEPKINLVPD